MPHSHQPPPAGPISGHNPHGPGLRLVPETGGALRDHLADPRVEWRDDAGRRHPQPVLRLIVGDGPGPEGAPRARFGGVRSDIVK